MPKFLKPAQIYQLARLINKALRDNPITPIPRGSTPPKHIHESEAWEVALKKAVSINSILPRYRSLERDNGDVLEFLIYYFGDAIDAEKGKGKAAKVGGGGWSSKTVE